MTNKKPEPKTAAKAAKSASKAEAEPESKVMAVSQTTDAAALAAIDTSSYVLPAVKVPGRRGRKQVLHIAARGKLDGAAVIEEVRQSQQFASTLGDDGMHWLIGIEEARPGGLRDFIRQRGGSAAAVEGVVTMPEDFPDWKVLTLHRSYHDLMVHKDTSGLPQTERREATQAGLAATGTPHD